MGGSNKKNKRKKGVNSPELNTGLTIHQFTFCHSPYTCMYCYYMSH